MAEIHLSHKRNEQRGLSIAIQIENPSAQEPNRECAEVLCAIADQEFIVLDFPNEVEKITDILKVLRLGYVVEPFCVSIKIHPKNNREKLQVVLKKCGYTSQQFAIGSESQIDRYLGDKERISKFPHLAPHLTCIGQLECYKDRIEIIGNLSPENILERLKNLPHQIHSGQWLSRKQSEANDIE